MDKDETSRRAREAGLGRYLESHPEQLTLALMAAADLAKRLPKTLGPTDEPALVLRLPDNGGAR